MGKARSSRSTRNKVKDKIIQRFSKNADQVVQQGELLPDAAEVVGSGPDPDIILHLCSDLAFHIWGYKFIVSGRFVRNWFYFILKYLFLCSHKGKRNTNNNLLTTAILITVPNSPNSEALMSVK